MKKKESIWQNFNVAVHYTLKEFKWILLVGLASFTLLWIFKYLDEFCWGIFLSCFQNLLSISLESPKLVLYFQVTSSLAWKIQSLHVRHKKFTIKKILKIESFFLRPGSIKICVIISTDCYYSFLIAINRYKLQWNSQIYFSWFWYFYPAFQWSYWMLPQKGLSWAKSACESFSDVWNPRKKLISNNMKLVEMILAISLKQLSVFCFRK